MIRTIVILFLITLIPGLELRASIPMGIFGGKWIDSPMSWPLVIITCTLSNIIIGWAVYFAIEPVLNLFRKWDFCEHLFQKYLLRAQAKLRPAVEKYGFWGLAVFIGIPLPLTGAYTGAAGAYMLGMQRKHFILANVVGVCIAAVCVTTICLLIQAGCELPFFKYFIKQ